LVGEFAFWKRELEDPAMLILTRTLKGQSEAVSGEVPVAASASGHIANVTSLHGLGAKHGSAKQDQASPKKRARLPPGQRAYNVDERGHNLTNRRGTKLCNKSQSGECSGTSCPINPEWAHQCARCLEVGHGAKDCTREAQGKGKGKGKKGKQKRTQW
jgi:hypothetical protein